ncbi:MAG: DUF4386 domain-containing protein [Proteobacteria bacterium]|nr:DUF4386 domain-containing protein [Pseudomonadota bacterium]
MSNENTIARLAGALYLVVVVTGLFSLVYVPSRITVSGDVQATIGNIVAHNSLFRAGIAAFLIKQLAFLLLPLALFKLLRPVHQSMAIIMVALAAASVPIALVSLANRLDVLDILVGTYSQAFSQSQLQAQATLSLNAYGNGLLVTTLFWGLWLLPFGYLVIRSGFLPKILGALLVLGGLGYVTQVFWEILVPATRFPDFLLFPAAVGEIGICLWLLVAGVRKRQPGVT